MDIDIKHKILNIIKDIESGLFSVDQITKKYELSKYKYYTLLKEAEIKNPYTKNKDTKFRLLLKQAGSCDKESQSLNIEEFKSDCMNGMKLSDLMEKHKLSLYEVRELRKRYELKSK